MTEAHAEARGKVYRSHLDDLDGRQWEFAVSEAIKRQRFFPTVSELRAYAADWEPPPLPRIAPPDCLICEGTGFEIVKLNAYEFARPCLCRPKPVEEPNTKHAKK